MSTNSCIKIQRKDGSTTGIYCHWDGYIDYNGTILQTYYNTVEKVEELLKLGDLSSLRQFTEPQGEEEHNFESPAENVCVAYHRDRGEKFRQTNKDQEYVYTFCEWDGVWYVKRHISCEHPDAMKLLNIDYSKDEKNTLLLGEIISCCAPEVIEVCKKAAIEGRNQALQSYKWA